MRNVMNCCLCSQIAGHKENDMISRLLGDTGYVRRVAIESENFAVIPSIGPLVPGHTLLCPKLHVKNMACLQAECTGDYQVFKERLISTLECLFDAPVHCFEHGSAGNSSRIICSVDHAHLHLLPARVDVWESLHEQFHWVSISPSLDELRATTLEREYLYYESPNREAFVTFSESGEFESQYMRRLFAKALGRTQEWNWRENPFPAEVDRSFRILFSASR